jgi:hypothetical protein
MPLTYPTLRCLLLYLTSGQDLGNHFISGFIMMFDKRENVKGCTWWNDFLTAILCVLISVIYMHIMLIVSFEVVGKIDTPSETWITIPIDRSESIAEKKGNCMVEQEQIHHHFCSNLWQRRGSTEVTFKGTLKLFFGSRPWSTNRYELKIQGAYLSTNNCSEMHFCSKSDTHVHIIDYKVFLIVLILIKLFYFHWMYTSEMKYL